VTKSPVRHKLYRVLLTLFHVTYYSYNMTTFRNMANSQMLVVSKREYANICIINVYTRVHKEPSHEVPSQHCTVPLKGIRVCMPHGGRARS